MKYSKLFYRVKAVDRNLLSAFRSFEMCNGAQTLIKSHLYFLFQIYSQRVQRKDFTFLLERLFRARKRNVKAISFKEKNLHFQTVTVPWNWTIDISIISHNLLVKCTKHCIKSVNVFQSL